MVMAMKNIDNKNFNSFSYNILSGSEYSIVDGKIL